MASVPNTQESKPGNDSTGGLEEQLTHEKLKELQNIFEEADEDGGGGLDMDEFRNAMRDAMGPHLTDHQLDQIFMKVDTNCDGTVDWDEYLTYMLLEYQERDTMCFLNQEKILPRCPWMVPNVHKDSIVSVTYIPHLVKDGSDGHTPRLRVDERYGRYMSVGKDGIVTMWTTDMKQLSVHKVNQQAPRKSIWVTDATFVPYDNMLVISTTSSQILFYDVSIGKFQFMSKLTELEICPTSMHYWVKDIGVPGKRLLLWGDSRGSVGILLFQDSIQYSLFHVSSGKIYRRRIAFDEIRVGAAPGVQGYFFSKVHDDLIRHISYYEDLDCFLSCSRSSEKSMCKLDIYGKKEPCYFCVPKGIYHFDYSSHMNVIVTGGYDALVRVWNPYVHSKPIIILQGHKSPVIYVTINTEREMILSVSETREIMLHEMSTQRCMQTIFRKMVPLGPRSITAVHFNQARQALILCSNKMAYFCHPAKSLSNEDSAVRSHESTVSIALYNPLFNQVVSAGDDAMVSVWDLQTSSRVMQFSAHKIRQHGEEYPKEITAMTFDPTYRRLFTAGRDSLLKVWNFNNGACLREIDISAHGEVTSIIVKKSYVVIGGWGMYIELYIDDPEDNTVDALPTMHHKDDILTMAYYPPYTLASADYAGNIFIWSMETRRVLNLLSVSDGPRPLSPEQIPDKTRKIKETKKENFMKSKRLLNRCQRRISRRFKDRTEKDDAHPAISISSESSSDLIEFNETAIFKLIFLELRQVDRQTATLISCGADGWIRAWSTHPDSGLLGQFRTTYSRETRVTSIATDACNEYLVSGDDMGYIRVWDIEEYCLKGVTMTPLKQKLETRKYQKFTYIRHAELRNLHKPHGQLAPMNHVTNSKVTWVQPPLLTAFRGHLSPITHVEYVNGSDLILSSSSDCTIRVWTIYGQFVGIFGQKELWSLPKNSGPFCKRPCRKGPQEAARTAVLPSDIRRVASATTLRVLKSGVSRGWKLAFDVLRWITKCQIFKATGLMGLAQVSLEDDAVSDEPKDLSSEKKSEILGKMYKPTRRHHQLPTLQPVRQFETQISAFTSLPVSDLRPLTKVDPPQTILDINARQQFIAAQTNATSTRPRKPRRTFRRLRDRSSFLVHPGSHAGMGTRRSSMATGGEPSRLAVASSRWNSGESGGDSSKLDSASSRWTNNPSSGAMLSIKDLATESEHKSNMVAPSSCRMKNKSMMATITET